MVGDAWSDGDSVFNARNTDVEARIRREVCAPMCIWRTGTIRTFYGRVHMQMRALGMLVLLVAALRNWVSPTFVNSERLASLIFGRLIMPGDSRFANS